jgi:hypothetical protein
MGWSIIAAWLNHWPKYWFTPYSRPKSAVPFYATKLCATNCTDKVSGMSMITAVLEADADGTLHLPVPQNLRRGKVKIVATLQAEPETASPGAESKPETPLEALKELRKLGGLRDMIPDPVAWQREQRRERPLPGRD